MVETAAPITELMSCAAKLYSHRKLRSATKALQQLLRQDPRHDQAIDLLADIFFERAEEERALSLLKLQIKRHPTDVRHLDRLSARLLELERFDEAKALLEQIVVSMPENSRFLSRLGIALASLGDTKTSIVRQEEALQADPLNAEALHALCTILRTVGRTKEAVDRLDAALSGDTEFAEAATCLAHSLAARRRKDEAHAWYNRILYWHPTKVAAKLGLVSLLRSCGQVSEAIGHQQDVCAANPHLAGAQVTRGFLLQEVGRLMEAKECFETALAIEPNNMSYMRALTQVSKLDPDSRYFRDIIVRLSAAETLDVATRIDLHFSVAKILTDVGRHEESFEQQVLGNTLKRSTFFYDEQTRLRKIDRIRETFTSSLIRSRQRPFKPDIRPIFIVGMPRSGSTLVEQILASHSKVAGAGELDALWQTLLAASRRTSRRVFPKCVLEWSDAELDQIATQYIQKLKDAGSNLKPADQVACITDKMLGNFRYLGMVNMIFPTARIIHISRDPVDTCLSCFAIHFQELLYTYDLGELGRFYHAYAGLMCHWRALLPPETLLEVRYENVVTNFLVEARRIVSFCGLDWEDACNRFYETARPVRTASASQVRQPIYTSAVGRWRPDPEKLRHLLSGLNLPYP